MELLERIYNDPERTGAFGGVNALLKEARTIDNSIDRETVEEFLEGQQSYTLHKPAITKFKRRPTIVSGIGQQMQADLLDVRSHSASNDGITFLLTAVDVFSRRGWALPIKSKSGLSVVEALRKILREVKFRALQTDKGKEFYNAHVKALLRDKGVEHFSSENDNIKASLVERFNKSLRLKIHRYLTARNTRKFVDKLSSFVGAYNATEHSSTGVAPKNVTYNNQADVFDRLFEGGEHGSWKKRKVIKRPLRPGELVRISKSRMAFERGYTPNWTKELFRVVKILERETPQVYEIEDYRGEPIAGTFYRQELQRVTPPDEWEVEAVLDTRKRGRRKEYLVKWMGYPDSHNQWISEKDMTDL